MAPQPRPDFVVVGAGRAGTTSMHAYLAQHPQVFIPARKSSGFFYAVDLTGSPFEHDRRGLPEWFIADPEAYRALYRACRPEQVAGDVSPVYLASTRVAERIAAWRPDARIVVILRNPVDRVYSRWVGRRRDGLEPIASFEALVDREAEAPLVREDAQAAYLAGGMVSHVLQTYLDRFPADRIRILFFEDFASDTAAAMARVCRFLGVDDGFRFDLTTIHNRSGGRIRNPAIGAAWAASAPLRRAIRPLLPSRWRDAAFHRVTARTDRVPLSPSVRRRLAELYRDEVATLSRMTGRDLGHWLEA